MRGIGVFLVGIFAICAPLTAASEEVNFGIDYEALFRLHADQVIVIDQGNLPPIRKLYMPGEVVLEERGPPDNRRYSGTDMSGGGAVWCMAMILIEYREMDVKCPNITTDAQSAQLDKGLHRVLKFYADNTYPPVSYEALAKTVQKQIAIEWLKGVLNRTTYCEEETFLTGFIDYYDGLQDGKFQSNLDEVLAVPRLPVENDCL